MAELTHLSAVELADGLASMDLSALEVVEAHLPVGGGGALRRTVRGALARRRSGAFGQPLQVQPAVGVADEHDRQAFVGQLRREPAGRRLERRHDRQIRLGGGRPLPQRSAARRRRERREGRSAPEERGGQRALLLSAGRAFRS